MNRRHWRELEDAVLVPPGGPAPKLTDKHAQGEHLFPHEDEAKESLADDAAAINALQDRLYAEKGRAALVVLQGIDTAGKDGTIRGVFNETGPLGVNVVAFGVPSDEELAHDFLWRVHKAAPRKGIITIFNRSHYEDVLVAKVHKLAPAAVIEERYDQINAFEKYLTESGVTILKFMLHISRKEQGLRLQERLDEPLKRWKFDPADLQDRKRWNDFMAAYEIALARCSTPHAPWRVIPADQKWRRNAIIARIVRGALEDMNPQPFEPSWDPKSFKID